MHEMSLMKDLMRKILEVSPIRATSDAWLPRARGAVQNQYSPGYGS